MNYKSRYINILLLLVFGLALNTRVAAQCTVPVITSVTNTSPVCAGNSVALTAVGSVGSQATNSVRMLSVGANAGNREFDLVFSSGDRPGTITRVTNATFDALFSGASTDAARAALIKAQYDVLMFTWASPHDANITWGLFAAYMNLGGSIFMDGDYANVTNFSPNLVGIQNDGSSNCSYVLVSPAPFPVLVSHGINGCFVNNHLSINSWPSWMSPYIKASDNTTVMAVAGIYPSGNHGRLIVQGPDQDYHAVRNGGDPGGNQYKIMLNQIDFLSGNQGNFTWAGPNGYTATGGNPVIDGATAANAGVYTVTLTNTTGGGCSTSATTTVTVNVPSAITGNTGSICGGGTLALSGAVSGGTWSSNNTAVATVNNSGVVTGVSGGTAAITYTMAGGCPSFTIVTVNPPVAITGASSVVKLNTTTLTDASAGGTWSSSNTAIATVTTGGVVTGLAYGSATISYTLGSCYVTQNIFVTPAPYCTPAYSSAALACSTYSMYIINFSSTGANGTALSDNASGCTGTGYQDRRLAIAPVTFKTSNAYTASITVGPTYQQYVQAWIDFNDNSIFEASETVGGINNLLNTGSFAITIPAGATLGTHTMRVRCGYTGTTTAYPNMDACANYSYGEAQDYFVNVVANCVAPAITACPASVSQSSAAGLCGANVSYTAATVTGTTPTVTYSATSGSLFALGTTTVNVTATNACGTASCSFNVTVTDDENPTIVAPADVTVYTNSGCSATDVTLGTPTTGDNCSVASVTNDHSSSTYGLGTTMVTWTVTDGSGHTATASQNVTVIDNANPTIVAPADVTVYTSAGCTATDVALGTPATDDNCSVASVTNDHSSSTYGLGTTNVLWTVTDGSGNTATATQHVTVVDNVNPTITAPADVTVYTNAGCTATDVALGTPATDDNCSVASVTNDHSATTYGLGTTNVLWTVTDGSGNTATATQHVTVIDNVNPTITAPADVTVYTNAGCAATDVAIGTPATDDNCSVASVTNDHSAATYSLGTTNVLWTVTDGSGNTATVTQHVTVIDNVKPTIIAPADVIVYTNAGCTATDVALGTPTTDDNCSVASVTNDHSSSTYGLGTTNVTWTVTDGSGNSVTATQHVTVIDNVNPTITAPANVTAYSNAGCTATGVALGTPVTGDNCSVASVTNDHSSDTYPVGTTMVTWTITDGSGNTATATQSVTVIDNINPTITAPATVTRSGYCVPVAADLGTPATGDNCGVASVSNNAPALFPVGTTTVTWTVTDIHSNTATATQLVIVTPSTVTLDGTVSNVSCNGGSNGSITTSVGGGTSPYSYAWTTGATTANVTGKTAGGYTVTATDAHGCVASRAFTITQPAVLTGTFAMDAIRKTASCPNGLILYGYDANIVASATGGTTPYSYSWGTATSGCSSCATASLTAPSTIYSVTVTDAHGCTTIVSTSCGRDVRCTAGKSGDHKITVCHNGHDICIDSSALATHLGLGDAIGSCSMAKGGAELAANGQFAIKAFPNPYSEEINIQVESDNLKENVDVIIYDLTGRIIDSRMQQGIGQTVILGKNLIPGVYIAEVRQGTATEKVKIVKY